MAGIKFDMTGDNRNVLEAFKGVQQGVRQTQNVVERSGQSIENMFTRIKDSALGGFKQMAAGLTGLAALVESGNFIKTLYDDMAKFSKAMKEVSTLSQDVTEHMGEYKQKVVEMTTQIAIAPEEAAKALYQIESAGHHGADGLNVLEQSAKGAIGGVTETAIAADAITTILNSYNLQASEAAHINDLLFTTVRLGKTTYGELGSMIAQVTPIAASYGVAIEDVLAAIASLTKSGTKTSIAIRQVRDAITATTNSLGDGAFKTRSFLDAMDEVAEKTKGSESALKQDLSKLSAMNAVLALTGKNSASARQDLEEMKSSTGAATEAYEKMADTASNATTRLRNNIFAFFMPLGDEIRGMSQNIAEYLNEAFDTGSIDKWIVAFEGFVAAYALYRGLLAGTNIADSFRNTASIAATNAAYDAEIVKLQEIIPLKEAEAKSDLDIAVAEGRLTPEKAELVAATRAEAQAHLQNLQAMAAEAQAAYNESTTIAANAALRLEEAEAAVAAAEMKYAAAVRSGNAVAIETAETELNIAVSTKNIATKELQIAREAVKVASVKASAAATTAQTAATVVDTAAQNANATSTGILAGAKLRLSKALDAVKASFLGNPLFWMAATVIGVTYAVYKLVTAENAHEAAIRASNEELEKQKGLLDERQQGINDCISTIRNENATELDRVRAYNKLKDLAPEITNAYTRQQLALADMVDVQQKVNEQLDNDEWKQLQKNVEDTTTKIDEYKLKLEEAREEYERYKNKSGYEVGDDGYSKKTRAQSDISTYQAKIESLEAMLENYKKALDDFNEAAQQAADEARPIEIRIKEAQENVDAKEAIKKFYDEAIALVEEFQAGNDQINYATGKSNLEEFIETAQQELDDLRQKTEDNPMDVRLQMEYQEKQKILNYVIEMKNQMASSGVTTIPLFFKMDYQSLLNAWNAAKQKLQQLAGQTVQGGATTYQQDFSAAQKAYQDAQRRVAEISKNKSKYTKEDWTAAQSQLKNAKDNYAALGGDVSNHNRTGSGKTKTTKTGTGKNDAVNRAKQEARYKELQQKQKLEQERAAIDLQFSTTQAEIDAMAEGNAKTIAQITLDFNQRKEEIKRGYEDLKQEKIDQARQLWEADPKNKDKVFNPAAVNVDYTEEEKKNLRLQNEAAEAEYNRQLAAQATADEQAMVDYLKTYGSFQEQKLAITKEYEEKIKDADSIGERLKLQKEMEKKLSDLQMAEFDQSINWEVVFNGLDNVSMEHLRRLKESLRDALDTKEITAEQAKVISERINAIDEQMIAKSKEWQSAFGLIIPELEKIRMLEREAAAAEERLADAEERYLDSLEEVAATRKEILALLKQEGIEIDEKDVTTGNAEMHIGYMNMQQRDPSGVTNLTKLYEKLGKQESTLAENTKALTSAQGKAGMAAEQAGGSFATTVAVIDKVIHTINDNVQSAVELFDQMGISDTKFGKGFSSFAESSKYATEAWESLKSGNIMGVANGVYGSLRTLGDALGKWGISGMGSSDVNLHEDIERLTYSNQSLNKAIDALADELSDASVLDVREIYETQKSYLEQSEKNILEMMKRSAEAYSNGFLGIGGKHSSQYEINAGVTAEEWGRVSQIVGRTISSAGDFFTLSSREMYEVMMNANDVFSHVMSLADDGAENAAQFMMEYVEYWKKAEDLENQAIEKITGTSFDSLKDSFRSALTDMHSSAKDFAKNFEDMMFEAIVNAFILDSDFDKWMEDWMKRYSEALQIKSDSTRNAALKDLEKEYTQKRDELVAERGMYASAMGYTGSAYEQSASSKGWQSMGQETADELNGRFTALQIAGEGIWRNTDIIIATLQSMQDLSIGNGGVLATIRDMMITSNSYLEDIARYNKSIYTDFSEKMDKMNRQTEDIYNAIRRA